MIDARLVKNGLGVAGATAALLRNTKRARHLAERRATVSRADADLAVGDRIAKTNKHALAGRRLATGWVKLVR